VNPVSAENEGHTARRVTADGKLSVWSRMPFAREAINGVAATGDYSNTQLLAGRLAQAGCCLCDVFDEYA